MNVLDKKRWLDKTLHFMEIRPQADTIEVLAELKEFLGRKRLCIHLNEHGQIIISDREKHLACAGVVLGGS